MKKEQLHEYLRTVCPGRKKVVGSATLRSVLRVSDTELRKLVNRLRREGVPVASSRDGYFYAVTAGEVYTTIRQLKKMSSGLEAAIQGLESTLDRFGGDPT